MSIIYKTTNKINGKIYVGKTTGNRKDDKYYFGSGIYIKRAIQKYGISYFTRITLEECNDSDVRDKEIYWINILNTRDPNIGYNIATGGEGGLIVEREYLSKMVKEKQWGLDSTKRRQKMSDRFRGKNNPSALKMKITYPNGIEEIIESILPWCKMNNVSYDTILRWAHKGNIITRTCPKDTSFIWSSKRRFLNYKFEIC